MSDALIGKYAIINSVDGETCKLVKPVTELGNSFYLCDLLEPVTGERLYGAQEVLHLRDFNSFVFADYTAYHAFETEPE